jgi:hypothetical protein
MIRIASVTLIVLMLVGCGGQTSKTEPVKQAAPPPKITMFYVSPSTVAVGESAQLCYSVEDTAKVSLDPPVDRMWPALTRCLEIKPSRATTYTLTAENAEGAKVTATTEVSTHAPLPASASKGKLIIDISANPNPIQAGQGFQFCVHGSHVARWKLSAGEWLRPPDAGGGCVLDRPLKTTTYVVTAIGPSGETDTMQVIATVK